MPESRNLMFGELARYYDLLYGPKDYRAEVRRLVALTRQFGRSDGNSWLDVACGTGRHLEFICRAYSVVGVDRSTEMLRHARERLPEVRLEQGDMRTFRLSERFDVVTCLFSAIGHLGSERDLERTFANFARHLKPGGVVLVEPWIDPSAFRAGHVHMTTYQSPGLLIVRQAYSERRRQHSIIHYQYLVAEQGRGIQHYQESDIGLLVSQAHLVRAMQRAGLRARFLSRGLTAGRGLVLGTKSLSAS